MSKSRLKYHLLLLFLLFILLSKAVLFDFYRISSGSMINTLLEGDFLIVNRMTYGARTPNTVYVPFINKKFTLPSVRLPSFSDIKQDDVVVIRGKYPGLKNDFVKRVIALGGQTVINFNGIFFVDNIMIDNRYPDPSDNFTGKDKEDDSFGPVIVPEGKIFVLGDNRSGSYDSRHFGFVDQDDVIGKAWFIYCSIDADGDFRWNRFFNLAD